VENPASGEDLKKWIKKEYIRGGEVIEKAGLRK
jgi:hypothetical protein